MPRRKQQITEKVPTTPRKVIVYTDNLMTSDAARNTTAVESAKELVSSLADTLNTALVIYTSFRFNPELNMLEIIDPYNSRNHIVVKGYKNYVLSVKLFILPAAADTYNRPSHVYVRQAMECLQRQLGSVKIDELFVSFSDISLGNAGRYGGDSSGASEAEEIGAISDSSFSSDTETSSIRERMRIRREERSQSGSRRKQSGSPVSEAAASSAAASPAIIVEERQSSQQADELPSAEPSSALPSAAVSHAQQTEDSDSVGGQRGMDRYVKLWRTVSRLRASGDVGKIGLCDLNHAQLESLCDKSGIVPDMLQVHVGEEGAVEATTSAAATAATAAAPGEESGTPPQDAIESTPTPASAAPSSSAADPLDDQLREYAHSRGISIRTHSDSADMLPDDAFQTLAADFRINEKFPTTEVPRHGHKMDFMRPRWVANYSVFLKTRGLVANRGYIVMASSDTVLDPNSISKYYGDSS
ncbi:hypothetical protein H4S06_002889 [Coemansia sp. BCRC 34490]|nr:hypothetical protein H4S06_002889 [Coemansia sp. BCRC 34490]